MTVICSRFVYVTLARAERDAPDKTLGCIKASIVVT